MQAYQRDFIQLALSAEILQFGDFTLKSGRQSPYFFNMGKCYLGSHLRQVGQAYRAALEASGLSFDGLFGPAYKGISLAASTAMAFDDREVPYSFDRKEAKAHGEGGNIVGAPLKGDIVLIDDVVTAGTAIRASQPLIEAAGARLKAIVVALDRQEQGPSGQGATQAIQDTYGIPVISIITFSDLIEAIDAPDRLASMQAYRDEYGV